MRIALLRNPESGSGEARDVAELLRRNGASVEELGVDEVPATVPSEAERIVVAGGDGSIAPAAAAASRAGVPLAVVPVGTANDFASAHGLPDDPAAATELAVRGTKTRSLELAWMGDRPFVNAASAGLAPAAARKAHGLKGALGPAAYAVGAMRAAIGAKPISCRAADDGGQLFAGEAWQVTVASSGFFGGGSEVAADPQDGMLDLVVLEAGSRASLALRAYGLRRGTLERQDGVISHRGTAVDLEVPPGTSFNVDGEIVESGPSPVHGEAACGGAGRRLSRRVGVRAHLSCCACSAPGPSLAGSAPHRRGCAPVASASGRGIRCCAPSATPTRRSCGSCAPAGTSRRSSRPCGCWG